MNGLAASRPAATMSSVGAVLPSATRSSVLSRFGLDHRDGNITSSGDPARHHHVEGGLLQLADVGEADPAITDQGDAHTADRPLNGSPASWVDSDAALMATTSYILLGLSAMTVTTTWTSLRGP